MIQISPKPSAAKTQAAKNASHRAGRQDRVGNSWPEMQLPMEKLSRLVAGTAVRFMMWRSLWIARLVIVGDDHWLRLSVQ